MSIVNDGSMTSEIGPDAACALQGIFEKCQGVQGSGEHIIPNAIGGRKKTRCICVGCNSESGSRWDAVLTKQFNILCIFFGVKRQEGEVQNEMLRNADGEELVLSPRGTIQPRKPAFDERDIDSTKVRVWAQAPSRKQAIDILKGIAKKKGYTYSKADIEYTEELLGGELAVASEMDLAGPAVGRSLTKMVYVFSISNGLKKVGMLTAWNYLSGGTQRQCFCPYYEADPVVVRPIGIPIHVLHVKGDPKEKVLYGYIELLGLFKYLILLSDRYTGDAIQFTHALDPTEGKEIDLAVDLRMSKEELLLNLTPTEATARAQNSWVAANMPLYMDGWVRKNKHHRLALMVRKFISENGHDKLQELIRWLDREL